MSQEHCTEADREFVQFYHRRVAWLALLRYDQALHDADHTLALMDFVAGTGSTRTTSPRTSGSAGWCCSTAPRPRPPWPWNGAGPRRRSTSSARGSPSSPGTRTNGSPTATRDESPNQTLIEQLRVLEQEIRKNFAVEKTLREQLDEAVAREDYEQAARLRDQIRAARSPVAERCSEHPGRRLESLNAPASTSRRRRPGRSAPRRRRAAGRSSRRPGGSGRRN